MTEFIATVDRFEGEFAVLKHKDHEIMLPKDDLPEDITEGGFVTVITLSGLKEQEKEKEAEQTAKEKVEDVLGVNQPKPANPGLKKEVNKSLKKQTEDTGVTTTQDRINTTFAKKPTTQKIQEAINDVLGVTLGQEPIYESPEKKEIKELKKISSKVDKVSNNIQEEIKDHKTHEEG